MMNKNIYCNNNNNSIKKYTAIHAAMSPKSRNKNRAFYSHTIVQSHANLTHVKHQYGLSCVVLILWYSAGKIWTTVWPFPPTITNVTGHGYLLILIV